MPAMDSEKNRDIELLYEELKEKYKSGENPTERLFWDSTITEGFVKSLLTEPRLDVLLAWLGELTQEEESGYLSREVILPVVWDQDPRVISMLKVVLDRQAALLRERLLAEKNRDKGFFDWVRTGKLSRRLLQER